MSRHVLGHAWFFVSSTEHTREAQIIGVGPPDVTIKALWLSTPSQTPGYAYSPATPSLNKASTPLATPLDDAGISLLESYEHSNWAYSRLKAACSLQDKDRASATGAMWPWLQPAILTGSHLVAAVACRRFSAWRPQVCLNICERAHASVRICTQVCPYRATHRWRVVVIRD
eukprot:1161136-Pelagomonas_calceolata.AAC.1